MRHFDQNQHGARVIMLQHGDKPAHLQKFAQLKALMDAEMGFSGGGGGAVRGVGGAVLGTAAADRAFVTISATGTAVACVIVQRIAVGFAVVSKTTAASSSAAAAGCSGSTGKHEAETTFDDDDDDEPLRCDREPKSCSLGVKQMWVHPKHVRNLLCGETISPPCTSCPAAHVNVYCLLNLFARDVWNNRNLTSAALICSGAKAI